MYTHTHTELYTAIHVCIYIYICIICIYIYIYRERERVQYSVTTWALAEDAADRALSLYGRFPKFHRVSLGRDPGTLKSDIV